MKEEVRGCAGAWVRRFMVPLCAAFLIAVCRDVTTAEQQAQPSATDAAAHPFCRTKAATPEALTPDPLFDAVLNGEQAEGPPVLKGSPDVKYPRSAMDAAICGTVVLQILVKADGKVATARIVESLDKVNGIDSDALKTVSKWRFKPGQAKGKAVATVINARLEYVLEAIPVDPFEASKNIGNFAEVCGFLRPAAPGKSGDEMVRFQFSAIKNSLVVQVPASARDIQAIVRTPQAAACVAGPIGKVDGRPQITVEQADRIVINPAGMPDNVASCKDDPTITLPKIRAQFDPKYTPLAMRYKVQGEVEMDGIVMPNGRLGYVKVVKSLDTEFGLDDEAIATAYRWRFAPATRDGRPVPCKVGIWMEFRLH
jgi:TonB family protein